MKRLATLSAALFGQSVRDINAVETDAVRSEDIVAKAVAIDGGVRPANPISTLSKKPMSKPPLLA